MQLDSDIEYLNWCETEGTPEVVALCEHPVIADSRIDGKDHTSIIDMYKLYNDDKEEYDEVKYEKDLDAEKTKIQVSVQVSYSKRVNVNHKIVTDKYLETQEIKIRNWKRIIAILNLGRELNLDKEKEGILKILRDRGTITLAEVIILFDCEDWIIVFAVCRLLQEGNIIANLNGEDFSYTTMLDVRNV